jgi:hypothetical protein
VVPWKALIDLIEPHYPKTSSKGGRPPYPLATMLRIHLLQQWYDLSDPAMEDALIEVPTMRRFAAIDMISDRIPDETTILAFRHLLEKHDLGKQIFEVVKAHLKANGRAHCSGWWIWVLRERSEHHGPRPCALAINCCNAKKPYGLFLRPTASNPPTTLLSVPCANPSSSAKSALAMEFDHLGVFIKTLEQGRDMLHAILPIAAISDPIHDPLLRVSVQFLSDTSGIRYELVASNGPGNPVDAVISEQRNTLNHAAYRAKDFDSQVGRLREARCMPLGEPRPAAAFGGVRVLFFLTPLSMIVELIESAPDVVGTDRAR